MRKHGRFEEVSSWPSQDCFKDRNHSKKPNFKTSDGSWQYSQALPDTFRFANRNSLTSTRLGELNLSKPLFLKVFTFLKDASCSCVFRPRPRPLWCWLVVRSDWKGVEGGVKVVISGIFWATLPKEFAGKKIKSKNVKDSILAHVVAWSRNSWLQQLCVCFCWFSSETSWVEQCSWCLESDVGRCWKAAGAWRSAEFTQIAIRQNGGGQSARSVAWTKTFPSANPPRSHQSILLHELTSQLTQSGFWRDRPKKTQHNATGFPQDGRCFESISKYDYPDPPLIMEVNNGPAPKNMI